MRGVVMQHIGKSKVTKLNAKAGVTYPFIRLPKTCANEIGKVAEIFETQHDNRRALLVTFNNRAGPSEVIQPDGLSNVESRLLELESEIRTLKSALLPKECSFEHKNQKSKAEGEIRTRVVASTGP